MKLRPLIGRRGGDYAPELALAPGPAAIGDVGDGSFLAAYGYAWLAELDKDAKALRLFQAQAGAPWRRDADPTGADWVEVQAPPLQHPVNEIRHLALAFDNAGYPVVAYERSGELWLIAWDSTTTKYQTLGPYPGVDPVLIAEAEARYDLEASDLAGADVVLLYLSPDRLAVNMRLASQGFATETIVETLTEPAYLDQLVALPWQLEALGSLASDPKGHGLVLRSDLYPIRMRDSLDPVSFSGPAPDPNPPIIYVTTGNVGNYVPVNTDQLDPVSFSGPSGGSYDPA